MSLKLFKKRVDNKQISNSFLPAARLCPITFSTSAMNANAHVRLLWKIICGRGEGNQKRSSKNLCPTYDHLRKARTDSEFASFQTEYYKKKDNWSCLKS